MQKIMEINSKADLPKTLNIRINGVSLDDCFAGNFTFLSD